MTNSKTKLEYDKNRYTLALHLLHNYLISCSKLDGYQLNDIIKSNPKDHINILLAIINTGLPECKNFYMPDAYFNNKIYTSGVKEED